MPLFEGAFAAAVTPSRRDFFQMDLGATLEVIDYLCSHNVRGIALFGATGEFPHFTTEDRVRLTHMAMKRSRVPVIVNATASSFVDAYAIADHAAANGAAAVLVQPPYYFRYRVAEIRQFYREIIHGAGGNIPVLLYNLPAFNNEVSIELAVELLNDGLAAGIKDSSGDWDYFSKLLEARRHREFTLLAGNDCITMRARSAGADGFISGCACAVPELLVSLDDAIRAGNPERTARLGGLLDEFLAQVDRFPGPLGIKESLTVRGMKMGGRAIPYAPETERAAEEFREWFQGWLPGMQKEARA
ncbi:MAG TPA: dihydrodipicolinate synthase family protein [Bryobacteraceae bacterium]|nr:dihydrodipicolinate synthase family protein [Bryobacteraceae bacterium]